DESKKKEYFLKIISETDRMSALISTMLDFSKVESGKKSYLMKPDSIASLVLSVIDSQKADIQNRGFELVTTIDENIPPFEFDRDALRLILLNLIENALKYSKKERFLSINLSADNRYCALVVADKGMGIPAKELDSIFHRFHRVENENVKALEGSGLGLFLVQHAVKAHDGSIKVNSIIGKGSSFTVRLPLKRKHRAKTL
ncbi:MAG: HAMP domain-containing histidine kinase, partial [bacterium]|nr:HAMP domain-containing histidine kinase [bacterium]